MQKEYPKTMRLRPGLIVVMVIFIAVIVVVIFFNIYMSSYINRSAGSQNKSDEKVSTTAPDEQWYHRETMHKSVKPAAAKTVVDANATQLPKEKLQLISNPTSQPQTNSLDEELKKAMSAPISSNQIMGETNHAENNSAPVALPAPAQHQEQGSNDDVNLQKEKKTFLKLSSQSEEIYLKESLKNPLSPYELKAGAIIPAILITGINSDLPGQITAQVRSNVYDTISGKHVVVPQGAKLTGLYDSQVAYGQKRVLIVWKRVIFPNGQSINLEGMPGVDMTGYAGFSDQVDNHYFRIFGSVILMSVISAGAQLSQPQQQFSSTQGQGQLSVNQTLAASLGTNIMNTANMMTQKNLGIQPTLVIRPGYLFNVSVTKDIVFPGAYDERTTYDDK